MNADFGKIEPEYLEPDHPNGKVGVFMYSVMEMTIVATLQRGGRRRLPMVLGQGAKHPTYSEAVVQSRHGIFG